MAPLPIWEGNLARRDTYEIPSDIAHEAMAGPDGAVVIDVFSPTAQTGTLCRRSPPDRRAGPNLSGPPVMSTTSFVGSFYPVFVHLLMSP